MQMKPMKSLRATRHCYPFQHASKNCSRFFITCCGALILRAGMDSVLFPANLTNEFADSSHNAHIRSIPSSNPSKDEKLTPDTHSQKLQSIEFHFNSSVCEVDDTFQYAVDFEYGDLDQRTFKGSVPSVHECCKQCEKLATCTHWSYTVSDSACWLKNNPSGTRINKDIVSGRVSLQNFILRKADSAVKRPTICYWEVGDAPQPTVDEIPPRILDTNHTRPRRPAKPKSYIVVNEPRSGSSWLQEISQMHPGIKVQFELDLDKGDAALACKQCARPWAPDTKNASRLPPKLHPPLACACGMTLHGTSNRFRDVADLARRHDASLVIMILARRNHVAHAISAYRHFNAPRVRPTAAAREVTVPWDAHHLRQAAREAQQAYGRLLAFPAATGRPAHIVFYEDLKRHPDEVWHRLQLFLGVPPVALERIRDAEPRAAARPALTYLERLEAVRAALAGSEWYPMVADSDGPGPGFDDRVDLAAEFAAVCAAHPAAAISWRAHACDRGAAVPWAAEPASPGPAGESAEATEAAAAAAAAAPRRDSDGRPRPAVDSDAPRGRLRMEWILSWFAGSATQ